jgi:hypothetical protein
VHTLMVGKLLWGANCGMHFPFNGGTKQPLLSSTTISSTLCLASSPGSPIFFNARVRKEEEPGIQCHVRDVGPYARVGRVADRENCAWVSTIFVRSGSV